MKTGCNFICIVTLKPHLHLPHSHAFAETKVSLVGRINKIDKFLARLMKEIF